jgi:hypothetical protein
MRGRVLLGILVSGGPKFLRKEVSFRRGSQIFEKGGELSEDKRQTAVGRRFEG